MNEQDKFKIDLLVSECGFHPMTAFAYVEFDGKCAYCGEDLVYSRHGYAAGVIDHLLPKSRYPELTWSQENQILCCSLCNSVKGHVDLLNEEQRLTSMEILRSNRTKLIWEAKKYIADRVNQGSNANWWKVRQILRG